MKIGFIGLGLMGRPMAANLMDAGHELFINRVKPVSQFLVEKGATACDTPKAVAEAAEIVITIVSDTPDVEAVLFGENGAVHGLSEGKMVIDMSTISPVATRGFAEKLAAIGCAYLDAPVSGGDIGAKNATLTIMVGGSDEDFARGKPLFEAMGKTITHIGPVGDGQTAKLANQIVVGLTVEAVSEALLFAKKAGADPAKVREALMGGFAGSPILKIHGERMLNRTFDPGFSMRLQRKDMALVVNAAREIGLALPNAASTEQLMNAAIARGDGELDNSALIRTLEAMAGLEDET
ncbi:MAG: 2-hydroxy-3-oxopropionate reductase [Martelella sp.]|uniref:2-hydroxy-3-oxopropionate reductase n=1 Tax=Martelella sp. TaxID=1969699 RepID=UPI00324203D8